MLYPIGSMLMIAKHGAPVLHTLGYGFSHLGYLLLAAGILAGRFRVLGFHYRIPTLMAAAFIWIVGIVLINV